MRTSFQLPVTCLGSSDRRCACLYPNTLITVNFTRVSVGGGVGGGGGRGQVAFNLKGMQILNSKLICERGQLESEPCWRRTPPAPERSGAPFFFHSFLPCTPFSRALEER